MDIEVEDRTKAPATGATKRGEEKDHENRDPDVAPPEQPLGEERANESGTGEL
jgi:hypothetical protein